MPAVMIDTSKTLWVDDFDSVRSILRNFTESSYNYETKKYDVDEKGAREIFSDLYNSKLHVAEYTYESYSGSAFVLFEKDGKFFEVTGGHCSCNGLEGQWMAEEVTLKELIGHRTYLSDATKKHLKEMYDGRKLDGETNGS